ncbi:MAG TPA: ADOP family duplicated permease [Thermoanaerobaculia bacterium]|jgi:predicted permease|nr:ADOP family duplicated permease [Thermoanaerobaculia bacterium]
MPATHPPPPRFATSLLRALLPAAEREEVLGDLREEYVHRRGLRGRLAAALWFWGQVLGSVPALLGRSGWRGWTGFEPEANRFHPGGPGMESWIMDLRYAVRRLRSRPAYTFLAVLTLALGVGGTAAIFSIVRGLLLEPLPYAHEEEIAVFWFPFSWSEAELLFLRPDFPGFRGVAAYRGEDVTLESSDGPARLIPGISASQELFEVLGVRAALGRAFQPGDDRSGADPVAVLSYELWQEMGGDASILGRRVVLDDIPRTVVGVMPRGFWFPDPTARVWLPEQLDPENESGNYTLVGRLAPGQRMETMAPALGIITKALGGRFKYPEQWDKTKNAALTPIREYLIGSLRPALLATLAAMAVILLIACANVGALMLTQVNRRAGELAVRSALGADRRRITQQLLIEALVLGMVAGAVGALLAAGGFRVLAGALPLGAWAERAVLDWTLFGAAILLAVLAALAIALIPAFSLWRGDLRDALTRIRTAAASGGRVESGLVVAEVALAVLLAAGAALLVRSVVNLYAIDPGLDTQGVAVVDLVAGAGMKDTERHQILRTLLGELEHLPGVRSAALTTKLPLRGRGDNWGITVEGRPDLAESTTAFRLVSRDYFQTLGVKVLEGRGFTDADRPGGELVTVINEAVAKKYFPDVNPIGRRIQTGFGDRWERIVGVVENVAEARLTDEAEPARYMLSDQVEDYSPEQQTLVLRTERPADAASVLEAARKTVQRVAPGVAVQEATTMENVFAEAVGPARQIMTLLTLLTALALVLGAIGVYGMIAHHVSRRRREYGIRMALGLPPARVLRQVVGHGTALVGAGIVIGVLASVVLARSLASLLYGVRAADPMALTAATLALLAVGVLAAFVPAYRASRLDPARVLREQ